MNPREEPSSPSEEAPDPREEPSSPREEAPDPREEAPDPREELTYPREEHFRDEPPKPREEVPCPREEHSREDPKQEEAEELGAPGELLDKEKREVQKKATDVVVNPNAESPHAYTQVEEEAPNPREEPPGPREEMSGSREVRKRPRPNTPPQPWCATKDPPKPPKELHKATELPQELPKATNISEEMPTKSWRQGLAKPSKLAEEIFQEHPRPNKTDPTKGKITKAAKLHEKMPAKELIQTRKVPRDGTGKGVAIRQGSKNTIKAVRRPWKCNICKFLTTTPELLAAHMISGHWDEHWYKSGELGARMHRDSNPWLQEAKEFVKTPVMPKEMTEEPIKATEMPKKLPTKEPPQDHRDAPRATQGQDGGGQGPCRGARPGAPSPQQTACPGHPVVDLQTPPPASRPPRRWRGWSRTRTGTRRPPRCLKKKPRAGDQDSPTSP